MTAPTEDWISLAEQVSVEMNPAKLISLVQQLCSALDAQDRKKATSPLTAQTNP
jgi:hypothetical protein